MVRGRRRRRGLWQERGREGDETARGGGMVSAHWVWSGQVEEYVHACSITRNRWFECLKTLPYTGLPAQTGKQTTVSISIYLHHLCRFDLLLSSRKRKINYRRE